MTIKTTMAMFAARAQLKNGCRAEMLRDEGKRDGGKMT